MVIAVLSQRAQSHPEDRDLPRITGPRLERRIRRVSTFGELAALGEDKVKGKIVLFDAPYEGYGATVMYRSSGASRAGAITLTLTRHEEDLSHTE